MKRGLKEWEDHPQNPHVKFLHIDQSLIDAGNISEEVFVLIDEIGMTHGVEMTKVAGRYVILVSKGHVFPWESIKPRIEGIVDHWLGIVDDPGEYQDAPKLLPFHPLDSPIDLFDDDDLDEEPMTDAEIAANLFNIDLESIETGVTPDGTEFIQFENGEDASNFLSSLIDRLNGDDDDDYTGTQVIVSPLF